MAHGNGDAVDDGRSVKDLVRDLSRQTAKLARQELELAKAEMREKARGSVRGAIALGAAALIGLGAFGALVACIILAFDLLLPAWAAALITAGIFGAVAGGLAAGGATMLKRATPPAPDQTIATIKEDVRWIRNER